MKTTKSNGAVNRIEEQLENVASIKPIQRTRLTLRIIGTSPLVMHAWSEKARKQMRDKHGGKKSTDRSARDPEAEVLAATYFCEDGETVGVPAMALKSSFLTAAHKDLGTPRTMVSKALFIHCDDANGCIPIEYESMVSREDAVTVGRGSADLRYRPEFRKWSSTLTLEIDRELLQINDVVNLINRAGFGVGICEYRPEKGGEWGRFRVDSDFGIQAQEL